MLLGMCVRFDGSKWWSEATRSGEYGGVNREFPASAETDPFTVCDGVTSCCKIPFP
ncbi:hypothetical protein CEXT_399301, partial [Caerostris extrusa]